MDSTSSYTVEMTYTVDGLGEGEASSTSALVRPYRVLLKEGKNVGKLTFQYFRSEAKPAKVFGTFCVSPGNRLMFFPGLVGRKVLWHSKVVDRVLPKGFIDHISIESDFKTWHVTSLVNDKKEGRPWINESKLYELEPGLFLWFGLSLRNEYVLEPAPKAVKITSSGSPIEAEEFGQIVTESRKDSVFNILQLPDQESFNDEKPSFLHFDILVDNTKGSKNEDFKYKSIAPRGKPVLEEDTKNEPQFMVRGHNVRIPGFDGTIRVGVSQHQGKISEDAIISTLETER